MILDCRHLANGCILKCGCIDDRFDVISQSIMSGHNNMLYKYYLAIVPAYACNVCEALVAIDATTG